MAIMFFYFTYHSAQAQEEPSFNCDKASTRIERVLCTGGNSGMGWIDQTMADLYKSVRLSSKADTTLQTEQRIWLAKRNRCTGADDEVGECVFDQYRKRFVELTSPYDKSHITGFYRNHQINGALDSVLFPDGSLAISITSSGGEPGYDQCSITFRTLLSGDKTHYIVPQDADSPDGGCSVELTVNHNDIEVQPTGCLSYCGIHSSFDGIYKKQFN